MRSKYACDCVGYIAKVLYSVKYSERKNYVFQLT